MNRKFLVVFSFLGLAACQDITDPREAGLLAPPAFAVVSGTRTQVTSDPRTQFLPAISGDRIVWQDSRNDVFGDIYQYDIASGQEGPLVITLGNKEQIDISGDHVVFVRPLGFAQYTVFHHDLSTGVTAPISDNFAFRLHTGVSGDNVVWQEPVKNGLNDENHIFLHDLTTGQTDRITSLGVNRFWPAIDGDWVVWVDARDQQPDIYAYNLATQSETRITNTPWQEVNLRVQGGRVVWEERPINNEDISMGDLATGVVTPIATGPERQRTPDIFGNRVVYTVGGFFKPQVRLFDLTSGVDAAITDNAADNAGPVIEGNRVVWGSRITGNWDIFMLELAPETGDIIDVIDDALADGSIDNHGVGNALTKKLKNAQTAIDNGDFVTAATLLNDFINQVSAQSGKHIDSETADELIQLAQALLATLP